MYVISDGNEMTETDQCMRISAVLHEGLLEGLSEGRMQSAGIITIDEEM